MLAINDCHGQLEPVPSTSSSGRINSTPAGGAEYLATHLARLRSAAQARGAKTVTVAAGDLIGASQLLSAAFYDEPTIEAMNSMGLDLSSVGNHEFDQGWKELVRKQEGGCRAADPHTARAAVVRGEREQPQGAPGLRHRVLLVEGRTRRREGRPGQRDGQRPASRPGSDLPCRSQLVLSDGGDGFGAFSAATNKYLGGLDIDALAAYLGQNPDYAPKPTDRIDVQP